MGREICPFRITCKTWLEAADVEVLVFGVKGTEAKSVAVLKRLPALRDLTMRSMQGREPCGGNTTPPALKMC